MVGSPQAPRAPRPKPPPKPFTPAKPTPCTSIASPSSMCTPAVAEDPRDLLRVARFEVVVAEHGDDRQADGLQVPPQLLSLVFGAAIGQIAAQRRARRRRRGRAQTPARRQATRSVRCACRPSRRFALAGRRMRTASADSANSGTLFASCTAAMIDSGSLTAGNAHEAACATALRVLHERGIQFLVGGTFAFTQYTGVVRPTKDLDLFIAQSDLERTLKALGTPTSRPACRFPTGSPRRRIPNWRWT